MRKLRERQKLKINNTETLHRSIITRHEIKKQDEKRLKQVIQTYLARRPCSTEKAKNKRKRCCTKKKKMSTKSKGRNKHGQGKSK